MDKPYRIMYFIDRLVAGGAELLMASLARHLDVDRFSARICIFDSHDRDGIAEEIRRFGTPVDVLSIKKLRDVTAIPRLIGYLKEHRSDLVHTQLEASDILGTLAAALLGLPRVSTIHSFFPRTGKRAVRIRRRLSHLIHRHFCDRIIAVSDGTRRDYLKGSKDSPDRATTLYNGIELERFSPLSPGGNDMLRHELGIPATAPLLITVAMLREEKGIHYLIRALPEIARAVPDVRYLIVGRGPHEASLRAESDRLGLSARLIFAGIRKDVAELLSIADIFVLPTLTEALPTVLIEAMAARKPIVASAVGGIPEMILEGKNGSLVPPSNPDKLGQACIALLGNKLLQREMGETGFQIANEKFNIVRQTRKLEHLYLELIHKRRKMIP